MKKGMIIRLLIIAAILGAYFIFFQKPSDESKSNENVVAEENEETATEENTILEENLENEKDDDAILEEDEEIEEDK